MSETPPLVTSGPRTTRRVMQNGYHVAVIEFDGSWWVLTPMLTLGAVGELKLEAIYYDDEDVAVASATDLLVAAAALEQQMRADWYAAYGPAVGRESNPDIPGPAWVDPNAAPTVTVTGPATVTLPATADVTATGDDDGLPDGSTLTYTWSTFSDPGFGPAEFSPVTGTTSTVTFPAAGEYVLRCTVSDGAREGTGDLTVTVSDA